MDTEVPQASRNKNLEEDWATSEWMSFGTFSMCFIMLIVGIMSVVGAEHYHLPQEEGYFKVLIASFVVSYIYIAFMLASTKLLFRFLAPVLLTLMLVALAATKAISFLEIGFTTIVVSFCWGALRFQLHCARKK